MSSGKWRPFGHHINVLNVLGPSVSGKRWYVDVNNDTNKSNTVIGYISNKTACLDLINFML